MTPRELAASLRKIVAILEPTDEWRFDVGHLSEAADRLEATCATCVHFRPGNDLAAMRMKRLNEADDLCCHPSEAHPMHWQETRENFSCNEWARRPDAEEGP